MLKESKECKIKKDLIGKEIGCYTVLDEFKRVYVNNGTKIYWKCRCVCGNEKYIVRHSLLRNKYEYCEKCRPSGVRNRKLYHIYHGIKQRCYNPKNPKYSIYGGKGISMCEEWRLSFNTFENWALNNGYVPELRLSIDRIDNNGNYCPENCRWISIEENSARGNYGKQKIFTKLHDVYTISPDGEKIPIENISKFCRDNNLNYSNVSASLHGRISCLYHGWIFHSNLSRQ